MKSTLILIPLLALFAFTGCSETPAQADAASPPRASAVPTPESTTRRMLELAEAGDWGTYVDDFYGEQHKFRPGGEDRDQLVGMLTKRSDQIIEGLREVTDVTPTLSEDGTQAIFDLGNDQRFILYRDDAGRWTFHL